MPGDEPRFARISNEFCRNPDVTPRAARVFIFLRSHRDGWSLTAASIAKQLGMGRNTVGRALNDLEDLGYLRRVWERDERARFTELVYLVFEEPVPDGWEPEDGQSGTPESEEVEPLHQNGVSAGGSHCTKNGQPKSGQQQNGAHKKTNSLRTLEKKKTIPPNPPEGGSAVAPRRAYRLPEGWEPPRPVIDTMLAEHPWLTEQDLWRMHLRFTDYWRGVGGQRGRKLDWDATWRNWVRRDAERSAPRGRQPSSVDMKMAGYADAAEAVLRREGLA